MIHNVKKTILMAVDVSRRRRPLLIKHQVKKVAPAFAAFFVPKLLQEREQHQDGLNQAEHEHQPLVVIHDITPLFCERKPTHQLPQKLYHS